MFASVPDLTAAIGAYFTATNADPTPVTSTKTAEQIVEAWESDIRCNHQLRR